jgi:hypothetical protein
MKRVTTDRRGPSRSAAFVVLFLATVSISVSAQWPLYVPPGTPRTATGAIDLAAPAPRTRAGTPDLSGVWDSRVPPAGRLGAPMLPSLDGAPVATFPNVGANLKEGLPFTPWAAELRRQRMAANSRDNPDAHCLPLGFMQLHTHSQPRKIVQSASVIVIAYEANAGLRQIFLDGRRLPSADAQPTWYGYSVGHWDGDALVVETTGLRDGGWLDVNGSPFTDAARITERFRRVNFGRMAIDVTVDDPKAYTRPWTIRVNHRLLADDELIEFVCENEKDAAHLRE